MPLWTVESFKFDAYFIPAGVSLADWVAPRVSPNGINMIDADLRKTFKSKDKAKECAKQLLVTAGGSNTVMPLEHLHGLWVGMVVRPEEKVDFVVTVTKFDVNGRQRKDIGPI